MRRTQARVRHLGNAQAQAAGQICAPSTQVVWNPMEMRRGIFTLAMGRVMSTASKIRQADDQSFESVTKLTA